MRGNGGLVWSTPPTHLPDAREVGHDVQGTLILDIDGTLTIPGRKHAIDPEVIRVLADFLMRGGSLIFNSGATAGRIERQTLTPLFLAIDGSVGNQRANRLFERVVVMPENGSALLLSRGIDVLENELYFRWYRLHELHVPDKALLRGVIQKELVPRVPGSYIAGDSPTDLLRREYILSWKKVSDTRDLVREIEIEFVPKHRYINWQKIALKAARTTIDFVHADSGKTISVDWVLREFPTLIGPVIGFGDLGDEFAKVVGTVNVNLTQPNEFRRRDMPAMDLVGPWELVNSPDYVVVGDGPKAKVLSKAHGHEIKVLRDMTGEIIYAADREGNGHPMPTRGNGGDPIEIKPITYREGRNVLEVQGAGKGTAWMIRRLIERGYFDIR